MKFKFLQLFVLVVAGTLIMSCVSSAPPQQASNGSQPSNSSSSSGTNTEYQNRAKELVTGSSSSSGSGSSGSSSSSSGTSQPGTTQSAASGASDDVPPAVPGVLTPEEQAFLENYLKRITYMVYFDENAKIELEYAKAGVGIANRYLIERMGLSVIDYDQIERNKKDQMAAYQAETGGSIDLIQYIAQKFNADVYVEISVTFSTSTADGKYYATAQGTMKIYDTSTAQLLGSLPFMSKQAFSMKSINEAKQFAITGGIWEAMPKMVEQSKALIKNSLSNGIRFELIIQNTPDAKLINTFKRALSKYVRLVEQVSYSPTETKFYIFSFKTKDKIEDAIYDAADRAGLKDMYLVYSRGKSFTFNSGL